VIFIDFGKPTTVNMPFNLQAKKLFLTYPQCPLTPEQVESSLLDHLQVENPVVMVVARELHEDGNTHYHVYVELANKIHRRTPHCLDIVAGDRTFHGNYQGARSKAQALGYVKKYGDLRIYPAGTTIEEIEAPPSKRREAVVAALLDEGATMDEVRKEDNGFFLMHLKRIKEYHAWVVGQRAQLLLKDWVALDERAPPHFNPSEVMVYMWLRDNIKCDRSPRQEHLWIVGPARVGKSYLISTLAKACLTYWVPTEEWFDEYTNQVELIAFDEFNGSQKLGTLNGICQGIPFPMKRRGTAPLLKTGNPPAIFTSNRTPEALYINNQHATFDAFRNRITVVELYNGNTLINLCKWIEEHVCGPAPAPVQAGGVAGDAVYQPQADDLDDHPGEQVELLGSASFSQLLRNIDFNEDSQS